MPSCIPPLCPFLEPQYAMRLRMVVIEMSFKELTRNPVLTVEK
jgi:hypothetical protein